MCTVQFLLVVVLVVLLLMLRRRLWHLKSFLYKSILLFSLCIASSHDLPALLLLLLLLLVVVVVVVILCLISTVIVIPTRSNIELIVSHSAILPHFPSGHTRAH